MLSIPNLGHIAGVMNLNGGELEVVRNSLNFRPHYQINTCINLIVGPELLKNVFALSNYLQVLCKTALKI